MHDDTSVRGMDGEVTMDASTDSSGSKEEALEDDVEEFVGSRKLRHHEGCPQT
jgi:hypothetical protein